MKELIYIEATNSAPYVYIPSLLIRNALMSIDCEDVNFKILSSGSVRALCDSELKDMLEQLNRTGLEYEVRINTTDDWDKDTRCRMDVGLI
jgi:hypothetical protein